MTDNATSVLEEIGWDTALEAYFQSLKIPGAVPGRVVSEHRQSYVVLTQFGSLQAEISGKFRHEAEAGGYPVVGDWTVLTRLPSEAKGVIHAVLPRKSWFSRQAAGGSQRLSGGRTEEQVVAANIDFVFIVGALDGGRSANVRRIERYLTLVWNSGASPVIVLNKTDLCADVDRHVRSVAVAAPGVAILAVSALKATGLDALRSYTVRGKTVALLGPSGVGKSALINALLGEQRQETGEIRERDHTGRHTTSVRELILLPGGGALIDTPGMREIQMWVGEDDVWGFEEIQQLAISCRFRDCKHKSEPGCAVRTAIDRGQLDQARLDSFNKLQREARYHEARQANRVRLEEKAKWKKISQWQKARPGDG